MLFTSCPEASRIFCFFASLCSMNDSLFQPRLRYMPSYNLQPLATSETLSRLRQCRVRTQNDLLRKVTDDSLLRLPPTEYCARYAAWLQSIKGVFSQAYDLWRSFAVQDNRTLWTFCEDLNGRFQRCYGISTHAKLYIERQGEEIRRTYRLSQEDMFLLFTPSVPPASIILDVNMQRAKHGDVDARRYLVNNFYLSEAYVDRQVAQCTAIQPGAVEDTARRCAQVGARKRRLCAAIEPAQSIDDILSLDNTEELILWRIGNQRLVLVGLYQAIQKRLHTADHSYRIIEGEIDVDNMVARLARLCR